MTTKKASKKSPKSKRLAKPTEPKAKRISALDAAAKVLGGSKEPMTTKQMIETMAAKGLWKSPGGKTHSATLYSAIMRELAAKGKEARFKKADRGKFTLA